MVTNQGHFFYNGTVQTNGLSDDFVVMRCTGLRDSTGELIFENDVLQHPEGNIGERYFIAKWNGDRFSAEYLCGETYSLILQIGEKGQAKIIGTIFDVKIQDLEEN